MTYHLLETALPALGPTAGCVAVAVYLCREFTRFLSNHLSKLTRALSSAARALDRLAGLVKACPARNARDGP
jgi:hypothetical protein